MKHFTDDAAPDMKITVIPRGYSIHGTAINGAEVTFGQLKHYDEAARLLHELAVTTGFLRLEIVDDTEAQMRAVSAGLLRRHGTASLSNAA